MKKIILFFAACSLLGIAACHVSSANLSDVKMCETMNSDECMADSAVFNQQSPTINVSVSLKNAPDDTKVNFTWYYVDSARTKMGEFTSDVSTVMNAGSNYSLHCSVNRPEGGWPAGNYEVEMKINTDNSKPLVKKFVVQESLETFEVPHYSIKYPSSWEFEKHTTEEDKGEFTIWSPQVSEDDTLYETVVLYTYPSEGSTLSDYANEAKAAILENATGHALKENKKIKTSSGEYYLFKWTEEELEDKKPYTKEKEKCIWLANDSIYTLRIVGRIAKFEKYKAATDQIVKSFVLK